MVLFWLLSDVGLHQSIEGLQLASTAYNVVENKSSLSEICAWPTVTAYEKVVNEELLSAN